MANYLIFSTVPPPGAPLAGSYHGWSQSGRQHYDPALVVSLGKPVHMKGRAADSAEVGNGRRCRPAHCFPGRCHYCMRMADSYETSALGVFTL